jgi:hypothetical protein
LRVRVPPLVLTKEKKMPLTAEVFAVVTIFNALVATFAIAGTMYLFGKALYAVETAISKYDQRLANIMSRMEG